MPIYVFQCATCGQSFDRLQKLSDADPTACPSCGAQTVSRQLTAPQFRLAGGGWYETDFKKDGDKRRNLAGEGSSGGSASAAGSSEPKSAESKPAEAKSSASKAGESTPATPAKAAPKPAAH